MFAIADKALPYIETTMWSSVNSTRPPLPAGFKQIEITIQIIVSDNQFEAVQDKLYPIPDKSLSDAIAQALQLSGRFRVHPYQFDFTQPGEQSKIQF